ncbi:MAG TPA: hypothetical protein PLZ73_05035 [bacterium]|nr:hypothetical protein [bacterium]
MRKAAISSAILLGLTWTAISPAADFNGDGYDDIAVFRPSSGLWAVRGFSRFYFGAYGDVAAPGNYAGSAAAEAAVFRPSNGLWAIRGKTRIYFGRYDDIPITGAGSPQSAMTTVDVMGGTYTLNPRYACYSIVNWALSDIELSLEDGSIPGQMLIITLGSSTDRTIIADTGNVRLAGQWDGKSGDTITLIWDGSSWLETSRSDN